MDREIYIGENGLEKQIMQDLERTANPADGLMTVNELVGGYLATKTGVRQSTSVKATDFCPITDGIACP